MRNGRKEDKADEVSDKYKRRADPITQQIVERNT